MGTSVSINETASSGPIPPILARLEMGERLTEGEFAQYLMYIWAMVTHHWQVYYQFQNGMIEENVFNSYVARLKIILGTPLSRGLWDKRLKNTFPVDYQEFVDKHIHD
jgi:hypothetical protein